MSTRICERQMSRMIAGLLLSLTVFLGSCGSDQAKRVDGESANDDGLLLTGSGGYAVRAEWERGPQLGTDNALILQIIPRNGARMPLKNLSLTPWMTVHGHGSGSVQPVIEAIDANGGLYRVSNIFFVMAGPWDLRVVLESDASDTRSAETSLIIIPVSVP